MNQDKNIDRLMLLFFIGGSIIFFTLIVYINFVFGSIKDDIFSILAIATNPEGNINHFEIYKSLIYKSDHLSTLLLLSMATTMASVVLILYQYKNTKTLSSEAYTDKLTGASNRGFLANFFDRESIDDYIFVMIDIDHFKRVNDTYGHDIGDVVLSRMSRVVQSTIRDSSGDILIRLGGEEFLILLKRNRESTVKAITHSIERIRGAIKSMVFDDGKGESFSITASFGVNLISYKQADVDAAIKFADTALYKAKIERDKIVLFDENNLREYNVASDDIVGLLEKDSLLCFYQPIINLSTEEIFRYEALVRIKEESGIILEPNHFLHHLINNKERLLLIKKLFVYNSEVLNKNPGIQISINLEILDIVNEDVMDFIVEYSTINNLFVKQVTIEIVKVEMCHNIKTVEHAIKKLKGIGFKIAIDDFGVNFSKITHLFDDYVDEVKIDGTIIKSLKVGDQEAGTILSIIEMANKLNLVVTAEHVETIETQDRLKSMGVHYAQGFYIGRPSIKL